MENEDKRGDHYAVKGANLAETKIVCKCGATFIGDTAFDQMTAHMATQDAIVALEKELERRNVFDQDKDDEVGP